MPTKSRPGVPSRVMKRNVAVLQSMSSLREVVDELHGFEADGDDSLSITVDLSETMIELCVSDIATPLELSLQPARNGDGVNLFRPTLAESNHADQQICEVSEAEIATRQGRQVAV